MTRERRIGEDVRWRGCGLLRLQLRELPSFETGHLWDVREVSGEPLKLYVSRTHTEKPGYLMPGYVPLSHDGAELQAQVDALESIQVATPLRFEGAGGFDGTAYSIIRSGGFHTVAFNWWEKGPAEWSALTEGARSFMEYLRRLEPAPLDTPT
ncbi:hypothetical protein LY474_20300 [Myxococcus stipitatus]|uniref:hypothetical protein n=1 Tax=Myxococcus stipitatus TaxID=83455 RepID=UPI001F30F0E3|nr:hypothetical protein [Myxococcus stipitatus]MCE9670144.1 hypothetical protein [Myxococcus stipitatus]